MLSALALFGIFIVTLVDALNGDGGGNGGTTTAQATATGSTQAGTTQEPGADGGTGATDGAKPEGATSAGAGGDANRIPDSQQFTRYTNRAAGYSIEYPKGWKPSGPDKGITINGGANFIHLTIATGPQPSVRDVRTEVRKNPNAELIGQGRNPTRVSLPAGPAVLVKFSSPGGAATLHIDGYRFSDGDKPSSPYAGIDLATPEANYADNEDDFAKIINSFRWL
jgi:hypothetical protein